ncbi:lipopolysaccharide biosynthesis protein [Eoetvoesiella caeni]
MLLRTIMAAKLFDVDSFAEYSAGLLVSGSFCMLSCLGFYALLQREMPMMVVRERMRPAVISLAQCVILALICATVLSAATTISSATIFGLSRSVFLLGLVHGFSQQLFLIATIESRSRGQSMRYARQNVVRGAAVCALGMAVAFYSRSAMLTLAIEALVTLVLVQGTLIVIFKSAHIKYRIAFSLALYRLPKAQWRAAIILCLVGAVGFLVLNADRWLAAQALPPKQFALYAFAAIVLTLSSALQSLINASLFPFLARRFASLGAAATYSACWKISLGILVAGIVVGVPAWVLASRGITLWFPEYHAATVLLPVLMFIGVLRVSDFWSAFMIIAGFEARLLFLNSVAGFAASLCWILWFRPWATSTIEPLDVAVFAAFLSAFSYIFVVETARRAKKDI